MKAEARKSERPSLLSKRVLRTNKINGNETVKLQERLREIAGRQRQKDKSLEEEVLSIKNNLSQVRNVKEKMEISPVRRRFLMEHGVKLQVRDVYMEDFITAVDNVLQKPDKVVFLSNNGDDKTASSEFSSCISIPELAGGRETATPSPKSVSYCEDNFPLHLPIHMLRKKTKCRGSNDLSLSVESIVDDEDITGKESTAGRSSRASSFRQSRPMSGKSQSNFQFRVITPPLKGRKIIDVYKELEEEEKLVQKLLEKKKFHDRVKREEEMKKKSGSKGKKRAETEKEKSAHGNLVTKKIGKGDDTAQDGEYGEDEIESRNSDVTLLENDKCKDVSYAPVSSSSNNNAIKQTENVLDVDVEFEKLMQKSLRLKLERKQRSCFESTQNDISLSEKPKGTNTSSLGHAMNYLKPGTTKETKTVENSRGKAKHLRLNSPSHVDGLEFTVREENKIGSSFDVEKWNELARKIRGELKETRRPETANRAASSKARISRISHPTAVDMDEDIIYDARPEKSVAKGYATMQMTVGKRSVSVCIPRFKNEAICKEQTTSRASAKSEMNVEHAKEMKHSTRGRATSVD